MARAKRGTLSPKIPSDELAQALNQAAHYMKLFGRRIMTAELLLYAYLKTPDTTAYQLLRQLSDQRRFNWASFEEDIARQAQERITPDVDFDFKTDENVLVALSDDILYIIDKGLVLAETRSELRCSTEHTLVYMAQTRVSTGRMLNRLGITSLAVEDLLPDPTLSKHATVRDFVGLAKQSQSHGYYMREKLMQDLKSLLSMSVNRNVILVGPTGAGKRSLVYALGQVIADGNGPLGLDKIIELDEKALLDQATETVRTGLRQAKGGILFVPNIARFFGGFRSEFPEKAGTELKKAFYDDQIVILGTTTPGRFDDRLQMSDIINQNANVLRVPPTEADETVEILKVLKPKFEADYDLTIKDDSLETTVRLAGRYMASDPLPGAAVHLLHRTCVQVNLSTVSDNANNADNNPKVVATEDVMVATNLLTGIPVASMGADERDRYANMVEHLHKRIIGQEEAVLALSQAVRMARVGLKDPKRPIGSFLFLGPTGTGKSELAKALAEFLFDTEDALITLDMSEYMNESAVNRLIGSPPGYVGHEEGGQLTEAVLDQPYSVVLFDEVEKAALKVFDVLLQIMDEGRLTSGQGETVSFSECVILMTSNIGSRYLANPELSEADAHRAADTELTDHFRPEFLNRLDDIIFFHLLNEDHLRQIFDILMRKEQKMLANRELELTLSEEAKTWILDKNEHPEWGGRPLRRLISRYVRTPLASYLLEKNPGPGTYINVIVKDDAIAFDDGS
ncbi:MAG: ATP-dependent Clp protease ATP-binding subunit [Chloroflexota bacterium]